MITCHGCGALVPNWMRFHHAPEGCGQYTTPAKGGDADGRGRRKSLDVTPGTGARKVAPVPDTRPEAEIRHAIVDLLRSLGYGVWDTEQGYRKDGSTRVTRGLPDLFVAGPAGVACVEVKSAKGKQTPEQQEFERLWSKYGGVYMVWRSEGDALAWHEQRRSA